MATTQNNYTGNGSNKLFSITFPYLDTPDIDVSLNGTLQTVTTQYFFANATTIEFVTAPANGAAVRLDRSTDDSALAATFFPGSSIKAADLNADFDQTLYVVQEINNKAVKLDDPLYANKTYIDNADALKVAKAGDTMSGNLAMGGNKVTGLGTPSASADAATKVYVDTVTLAGNVPDGDRGDITVSGVGTSWTIDTGAVTETKLGTGSVTSAKILDGTILNADVNVSADIAATKLAFTQAGTGATTRTVDSKLKDIISVKDFGATGDGSTDDTAAIQAAINQARLTNAVVYFPPNNTSQLYKITAPLTCDGPISIIGAGPQAVTIWAQGFSAGQYILDFNLPVATNYYFDIKGITLRSNNQVPNGIRLKNTSYCTLTNVQLYNVANGVVITGANCFSNYFENLSCYLVSGRSVLFQSFTGGGHYTFNHCTFTGNYGFEVDSASGINELAFISCNFEQCVTNSVSIIGTIQGLSFVGCRTEGLDGTADFLLYPSAGNEVTGLSVTGCYFTTDAGASVPIYLGGNSGAVRGFNICGNHVEYAASANFVTLNGDGESGVIAGNYFNLTTTTPTNTRRPGVVIYANENATGKCVESWGNATWGVEEGTFTPSWIGTTVAGNTVPSINNGKYTRNGNMVTVWIWGHYVLNSYSTKPTGQVRINNLPFVAASTPYYYEFPVTASRVTHTLPIFGQITEGTSYILLYEEAATLANNPTAVDWTSVRDPYGGFSLQFSYRI